MTDVGLLPRAKCVSKGQGNIFSLDQVCVLNSESVQDGGLQVGFHGDGLQLKAIKVCNQEVGKSRQI